MSGIQKIEICVSNAKLGSGAILEWIRREYPSIRTKQWGCLGYCHRCLNAPYVLIDDDIFIEAETEDELRKLLENHLKIDESECYTG